ncbi:hypothetical protein [Haloactinomyces albus]|uniref:Uncharacterized protein n=1 Tax=Haloactinomyces albus TaxID=1352928 RepID=A0AAE3ZEM3_9ACTN|nr:hypothetical protein [Haloactinomyces albus]MDR7301604.1 hypothetical protein [Haloactinomyces albus]
MRCHAAAHQIRISTLRLVEAYTAAGMVDDDRALTTARWFADTTTGLLAPMRGELDRWFTVMFQGSAAPPRSRPRSEQIAAALPVSGASCVPQTPDTGRRRV